MGVQIGNLLAIQDVRPWIIAPAGPLTLPLDGNLGTFDFLMHDQISDAVASGFWTGERGEQMLVPPDSLPVAGFLLVGYGDEPQDWDRAVETALQALPDRLPGGPDVVAVLPPQPVLVPKGSWAARGDRFLPAVRMHIPGVRKWIWFDAMDEDFR